MPNSTIMGLDVGSRRVGVATASLIVRLPSPWGVVPRDSKTLATIASLVEEQRAAMLVVGLPRGLNGQETPQTTHVREFTKELSLLCDVPVYLQDEALTSKQAEHELHDRQVRYTKGAVDALAATYILTDFLTDHPEVRE